MPSPLSRDLLRRRIPAARRAIPTQQDIQRRYTPVASGVARTQGSVFGGPRDVQQANAPFAHGTYPGQSALTERGTNYGSFPASAYRTGAVQPQQWYPVTNPKTGQQTYIQALDVGPGTTSAEASKGVDISPAAAQQIGYTGSGQLQVGSLGGSFNLGGNVPSYSGAAGPSQTLATVSDLYGQSGGSPNIELGIGGEGGSLGPASYTPYNFGPQFGFDTSGDFGATALPPSPDFSGDTSGVGFQMPPMTSMPSIDSSSLMAASGEMSGTMSTDAMKLYPDQTPSLSVSAGDIGSTYGGGQNYNYSPAPDGGTYVYDANWNYVSTMPGSSDSGAPAGQTAQTPQGAPISSTPTASSTPSQSAGDTSFSTPYATQTQQLSAPAQSTADYSYYSQPGMGGQSFASYGGGLSSIGGYFEGAQTANMTGSSFGDLGLGGSGMPMGWGPRLL